MASREVFVLDESLVDSFTTWAEDAEPRVRHALTASFGIEVGKEATADALAHAWEHWDGVRAKNNPTGFVYGVGRNKARRLAKRRRIVLLEVPTAQLPRVEPGLPAALAALSDRQRTVVTLLYGFEWTMREVAELLGMSKTTVQTHAERGLDRLRAQLRADRS